MSGLRMRSRFMLVAALLVVGVTVAMSLAVLRQVRRSLMEEVEKRGQTLCGQLGHAARFPLRAGDAAELSRIVHGALALPDVAGVTITDAAGRPLARELAMQSYLTADLRCPVAGGAEYADPAEMAQGAGSAPAAPVGEVRVSMSLASAHRRLGSLAWAVAGWALALAAAALLLGAWLARRLSRPVEELAAAAEAVGAGRLDVELRADQGGEIGLLAGRFNQMARDLKQSIASMLQQEKMATLGKLASGISHEIGSPLNSILMDAHLLAERAPDPQTREAAQAIVTQTRRISETVRNLLDYARLPSEQAGAVELAAALDEALMVLAHPVRKSGVTMVRELPADLPRVRAVKNPCVQVFVNLLRNALDACGRGGEVRVSAVAAGGRVRMSFTDSGPGFAQADLARAFEPFFTTKPAGEGTGLGLAICATIMSGFGGGVRIEQWEGRWCRLTLEFSAWPGREGAQ